jgi:hypothetical protein
MEKWENLKVYRNLPPDEIPTRFKEFAQLILASLEVYGFKLKETKTLKKLYRVNDEFEQSIHFENSSRWAKNQKEIHIYVCIKPLFSDKEQLYRIFEAFQVDTSFKMYYPLTQEFKLLAENIIEKIQNHIIPFFDRFSTSEKIVNHNKQLAEYYKIPNTDKFIMNFDLRQLLYECAFLQRDKHLFYKFNGEYLNERIKLYEQFKSDSKYEPINLELINELKRRQQVFDDNEQYRQEINLLNEKSKKYLEYINKQKPSR